MGKLEETSVRPFGTNEDFVRDKLRTELGFEPNEYVVRRATNDEGYLRRLLIAKQHGPWLSGILTEATPEISPSVRASIFKFVSSHIEYARNKFEISKSEEIDQRRKKCLGCPELKSQGKTFLSSAAKKMSNVTSALTCGLCGCLIEAKVRRAHEQCPREDPKTPGLSMWGKRI